MLSIRYLNLLIQKINNIDEDWGADLHESLEDKSDDYVEKDRNAYLIQYSSGNKIDEGFQNMVLMGDGGLTWEPAKVHRTPCYAVISGTNVEDDVKTMIAAADRYYAGEK